MKKSKLRIHLDKWNDCQKCYLSQFRSNVVQVRGNVPCDVLFIGEAPGDSENALGVPFKGPAGNLLQEIINTVQKTHKFTYAMTNLVGCIPKEDGIKLAKTPKECINACKPRLDELIKLCNPNHIIFVGNDVEKHIIGIVDSDSVTSTVIEHPAAILRKPQVSWGLDCQKIELQIIDLLEYEPPPFQ